MWHDMADFICNISGLCFLLWLRDTFLSMSGRVSSHALGHKLSHCQWSQSETYGTIQNQLVRDDNKVTAKQRASKMFKYMCICYTLPDTRRENSKLPEKAEVYM